MQHYLTELNEAQRQAVLESDGASLIIAGAGSGKTRVLTTRVAYLLDQGVRPWEILVLTFTNKAAGEMKSRVASMIGEDSVKDLWMGTFHSVFARILRSKAEELGYTRSYTIYDTDDSLALIKRLLKDIDDGSTRITPQMVRSQISKSKNRLESVDDFYARVDDAMGRTIARVYDAYTKQLYEANAMDFDDLLVKTVELFTRFPHIRDGYARQFQYVLVDEYQDTNRIQYLIVKELASYHGNIAVVGDDAQSIYSFRGADIRNILDFQSDFPDVKTFRLEQNYRSTQHILDAANAIIESNKGQIPKKLFTKNASGTKVQVIECIDDRSEAQRIVREIEELSHREKYTLNEFAVLYRMNAQSRSLEDALRRSKLAYVIVGGISFYKRAEIKDVVAYIRLLVNRRDAESTLRIINFPARGIGTTTLERLVHFANENTIGILDAIDTGIAIPDIQPRFMQKLREFSGYIKKYSDLREHLSPGELLNAYIGETGILQELKLEGTSESLDRYENVREFLSYITDYFHEHPGADIESFLEEMSLISDIDDLKDSNNAVRLMTIHSAKGLEFPVVFVAGLEEGLFPSSNALEEEFGVEEERRLLYVAVTRAMKRAFVLYAQQRLRYGSIQYNIPSRFIEELQRSDSVETESLSDPALRRHSFTERQTYSSFSFDSQRSSFRRSERSLRGGYSQETSYNEYSQIEEAAPTLKRGELVFHESFGEGRVIEVTGTGDRSKAVVDFPNVGRKNLMLKFAGLKKL